MGKDIVQFLGRNILHWPTLVYGVAPASPNVKVSFSSSLLLLFLFSSVNDKISLSSNCFFSFDFSNKLGSIFASHSDSSSSEKYFKLSAIFFVTSCVLRDNLLNRSSGVQIPRDICTCFGRYLHSRKCSWIIKPDSGLWFIYGGSVRF